MKANKLCQISELTQAIYRAEFQKVQAVLNEEARLRNELSQLQRRSEEGRQELQSNSSMRLVGADLLWQSWLTRAQRQLSTELSQVIAHKLTAMRQVQKAFGRQCAAQSIHGTFQSDLKKVRQKRALEALTHPQQRPNPD